jgi:hypothetical protein
VTAALWCPRRAPTPERARAVPGPTTSYGRRRWLPGCHPCGQQRQSIERALAHPPRAVTLRQRSIPPRCRGRSRRGCSVGRPGTQGAGGRGLDALEWAHAVQGHLPGATWLLPAAWEASVVAGGDVIRAADGLEASGWQPGVPVLHATAHTLFPYIPRCRRQSRRIRR